MDTNASVQEHYKKLIISIINNTIPSCTVYLFGSRARGTQGEGSDIDIAIDAGKPVSRFDLAQIKETIEESIIPYFVDAVDMQSTSMTMKNQILKEGIIWKT